MILYLGSSFLDNLLHVFAWYVLNTYQAVISNEIELIWWNWFDKTVLIELIGLITSCDHGAKSFLFLFWIINIFLEGNQALLSLNDNFIMSCIHMACFSTRRSFHMDSLFNWLISTDQYELAPNFFHWNYIICSYVVAGD